MSSATSDNVVDPDNTRRETRIKELFLQSDLLLNDLANAKGEFDTLYKEATDALYVAYRLLAPNATEFMSLAGFAPPAVLATAGNRTWEVGFPLPIKDVLDRTGLVEDGASYLIDYAILELSELRGQTVATATASVEQGMLGQLVSEQGRGAVTRLGIASITAKVLKHAILVAFVIGFDFAMGAAEAAKRRSDLRPIIPIAYKLRLHLKLKAMVADVVKNSLRATADAFGSLVDTFTTDDGTPTYTHTNMDKLLERLATQHRQALDGLNEKSALAELRQLDSKAGSWTNEDWPGDDWWHTVGTTREVTDGLAALIASKGDIERALAASTSLLYDAFVPGKVPELKAWTKSTEVVHVQTLKWNGLPDTPLDAWSLDIAEQLLPFVRPDPTKAVLDEAFKLSQVAYMVAAQRKAIKEALAALKADTDEDTVEAVHRWIEYQAPLSRVGTDPPPVKQILPSALQAIVDKPENKAKVDALKAACRTQDMFGITLLVQGINMIPKEYPTMNLLRWAAGGKANAACKVLTTFCADPSPVGDYRPVVEQLAPLLDEKASQTLAAVKGLNDLEAALRAAIKAAKDQKANVAAAATAAVKAQHDKYMATVTAAAPPVVPPAVPAT